jgi:FtsZ-binding cell division protein ZapB
MTIDEIAQKAAEEFAVLWYTTNEGLMLGIRQNFMREVLRVFTARLDEATNIRRDPKGRPVAPVELPPDFGKLPEPEPEPFFGDNPIDPNKGLPEDLPVEAVGGVNRTSTAADILRIEQTVNPTPPPQPRMAGDVARVGTPIISPLPGDDSFSPPPPNSSEILLATRILNEEYEVVLEGDALTVEGEIRNGRVRAIASLITEYGKGVTGTLWKEINHLHRQVEIEAEGNHQLAALTAENERLKAQLAEDEAGESDLRAENEAKWNKIKMLDIEIGNLKIDKEALETDNAALRARVEELEKENGEIHLQMGELLNRIPDGGKEA